MAATSALEVQRLLAVERVRAEAMAMRSSDHIPTVLGVIFADMVALGVLPDEGACNLIWIDDREQLGQSLLGAPASEERGRVLGCDAQPHRG